jgi:hypothetical protein
MGIVADAQLVRAHGISSAAVIAGAGETHRSAPLRR